MGVRTVRAAVFILVGASLAAGQAGPSLSIGGTPAPPAIGGRVGMMTMHAEDLDVESATGLPFCATVVTEHTQTSQTVTAFIQTTTPVSAATAKGARVARRA